MGINGHDCLIGAIVSKRDEVIAKRVFKHGYRLLGDRGFIVLIAEYNTLAQFRHSLSDNQRFKLLTESPIIARLPRNQRYDPAIILCIDVYAYGPAIPISDFPINTRCSDTVQLCERLFNRLFGNSYYAHIADWSSQSNISAIACRRLGHFHKKVGVKRE
jgi:hypothetical protein